jgi:hypothetical protein
MAFDFEALVGHLYMVGGRTLSAQPPGMLIEVAPKRVARGRELDTIFILVSPSGEGVAPAAFYDRMANKVAELYFESTGSVTAGLRTVFTELNQELTEYNTKNTRQYEANVLCAIQRERELFIARAGSSIALYRHEAQTVPFPGEFVNDETLFGPPIGVQPVPEMKMSRYTVEPGSRLVLSDSRLADLNMDRMTGALCTAEITDVLAGFKDLMSTQAMLMVAEFVPPEAPSPEVVKDSRTSSRPVPVTTAEPTAVLNPTASAAEGVLPALPVRPPRENMLLAWVKRIGAGTAFVVAGFLQLISNLLDRMLPPPAEGKKSWVRTSTATGIAVIIPLLMVGLVVVLGVSQIDQSSFERCVNESTRIANTARSVNSADRNGVLTAWNAVIVKVNECNQMRQGDPVLVGYVREAQQVIDLLYDIDRREARVIASLPNAALRSLVVQGQEMYILDSQNQWVYRLALASDGRSAVPGTVQPIASMRLGAIVGENRVGNLIDIVWSSDLAQILTLDENGVMVECSPRFLQDCQWQRLLAADNWGQPVKMQLWQGRLYLLDPTANQIWRYDSQNGSFNSAPIEYFSGSNRPDIRTAVSFAIDDDGNIYILLADGQLTKWRSGQRTDFAYSGFPEGQQINNADFLFLDTNPVGRTLYIVSQRNRQVYETTWVGSFMNIFAAFQEDSFASLSAVVADANQELVYVLSGNTVFVLEKVPPGQATP